MKCKLAILLSGLMLISNLCACGAKEPAQEESKSVVTSTVEVASTEAVESATTVESVPQVEPVAEEGALTYQYTEENLGYSVNVFEGNNAKAGFGFVSYEKDTEDSRFIYITQYSGDMGDEEQKEILDLEFYEECGCIGAIDSVFDNIQREVLDDMGYTLLDYAIDLLDVPVVNGEEMCEGSGWLCVKHNETGMEYNWPVVAYGIANGDIPVMLSYIDTTDNFEETELMLEKIREVAATYQPAQ